MVSKPVYLGGLGFGMKWDMGWMHDTLEYFQNDPIHRKYHHNELTFRMLYSFHENFVLPLSHDEVVHGKGSLIGKMPGDEWQKFANLRLLFGYMYAQPGKKLLFMGDEFGQVREWAHDTSLEWHVLQYPGSSRRAGMDGATQSPLPQRTRHACLRQRPRGIRMGRLQRQRYQHDFAAAQERDLRKTRFSSSATSLPCRASDYRVGVPHGGYWREMLNSDAREYAGSGMGNLGGVHAEEIPMHGRPFSLKLTLPPLAALFFKAQ